MLDVQPRAGFVFILYEKEIRMQADETPEDRLEAALERIARSVATPDTKTGEVAERLDRIIASVRMALGDARKA